MKPIPIEHIKSVFQNIRSGVSDELFRQVIDNPKHQRTVFLKIVEVLGEDTVGKAIRNCFLSNAGHKEAFINLYRKMIISITAHDMLNTHLAFERKHGILKDKSQEDYEHLKKILTERRQLYLSPQKSDLGKLLAFSPRPKGESDAHDNGKKLPTSPENNYDSSNSLTGKNRLIQLRKTVESNQTDEEKAVSKLCDKLSTRRIIYTVRIKEIYLSNDTRIKKDAVSFLEEADARFLTLLYLSYLKGSDSTEDLPPNLLRRIGFVGSSEPDYMINALDKKPAKPKKENKKPKQPLKKLRPKEKMQLIYMTTNQENLWKYKAEKSMSSSKELHMQLNLMMLLKNILKKTETKPRGKNSFEYMDHSEQFLNRNPESRKREWKLRKHLEQATGYSLPDSIIWDSKQKKYIFNGIIFKLEDYKYESLRNSEEYNDEYEKHQPKQDEEPSY